MTVPVSADTVKTNQDSDITKPDALTDNGILTHTDTVNKVGNDVISSESAKITDSRKFQTSWEKLWPWASYDKSTGKMYCEACIKTEKNTFTTGCTTYKMSSMIRHEATADHKISVAAPKLNNNMTAAINNAKCEQDEAIIKTLKLVNCLACENVPLLFCLVFCLYRFTNTYPLMAHTFYTMAHTNLKWPIDLCQHGAIGPLPFFSS